MTDFLSEIYLYKDVSITRDYSVVHDMSWTEWYSKLQNSGSLVWHGSVNYYRLGNTIRIESSYENIRKATYGILRVTENQVGTTKFTHTYFFWVDGVKLLKNGTGGDENVLDVVELAVSEDIWSNYNDKFDLKDSYVERRHMPRWDSEDKPIYYPDASQGVDGAYILEKDEDLTPGRTFEYFPGKTFDLRFIVVNGLSSSGETLIAIGCDLVDNDGLTYDIRPYGQPSKKIFTLGDVLDGTIYSMIGGSFEASHVQSITVVPYMAGLRNLLKLYFTGSTQYFYFDEESPLFSHFRFAGTGDTKYITLNFGIADLEGMMDFQSVTVESEMPSRETSSTYRAANEPMLYLNPARCRKVVSGMGGTVFDVPDITAFETEYTARNSFDLTNAITFVFTGNDIVRANAMGSMGVLEAASLPIYNSAWKTYEAISKAGDDRVYDAQQLVSGISTAVGIGMGAASIMTGGATAALGGMMGGSSAVSGISSMYLNDEQMRAKRTTIRNSPCTVTSTGSGMGAYVLDLIDLRLLTLKLDPVSFSKLEEQYYFYGYFVNKTERGTVNLHTRKVFDFVKTSGARVTGSCPADVLREIGAIFDRGVTIYHGSDGYGKIGTGMQYSNDEYTAPTGDGQ